LLCAELATPLRHFELAVELRVAPGECLAVVGPSGAGKSSLLRALAGLLRPQRGRIECGGETWLDTETGLDLAPEQRRCGFVFQDYALFGQMSAWRNVAYGLGHLPRGERRGAALALLDRFGIAALAEARPATLSGGERQRLALARALGARPRALLLDEPLAALDATTRAGATRELQRLAEQAGVPALLVTHDFLEASLLADRVAVIEAGRIVQEGDAEELAARPASAFVADLTGQIVLSGIAAADAGAHGREIALDGGGRIAARDPDLSPGPVAVAVHPWEIALEPAGAEPHGSARNRLAGTVRSVTRVGGQVRVGLDVGQTLVAEITPAARAELGLEPGSEVVAVWKASATRIVPPRGASTRTTDDPANQEVREDR
jgi:molybdate transport system ATP-binding protein